MSEKNNMGTKWRGPNIHGVVNKQHYVKLKANKTCYEITWLKFGTYTFWTISFTR